MLDFDAGKYAVFVWPAYGLSAVAFVVMITGSLTRARRWRRLAEQREKALDFMKRALAIVPFMVLAALAALFALRLHTGVDPHYIPAALVGQPMPDEALPPLAGGQPTSLRALVRPATLVNFFASWCAPCVEETPTLMALKDEGVRIVGVAWKDDPAAIQSMLGRTGNPFQAVVVDRDGRAGLDFGVSGAPETFVIGADGKIKAKVAGALTGESAERLLEKADAPG